MATAYGPVSPTYTDLDYFDFCVRTRIAHANLVATGTQLRITVKAGSSALNWDNTSVGLRAASGDEYDTAATPVNILWSGAAPLSLSSGASATSDWATITVDGTTDLVFTWDFAHTGNSVFMCLGTATGAQYWVFDTTNLYNVANVTATPVWTDGAGYLYNLISIEVQTPGILFRPSPMTGIGGGGPFFSDPLAMRAF